jgi:predicted DNA-binding transcriptional regulator YafY
MPKNKNAYLRLRLIDQCLRNKNKYFNRTALANKVSEKLGYTISINTIDKDLKALLDEFKAPIKFDKFYNRYYYSKPFTLDNIELDDDEKNALNISISILNILKNTRYAESFKSVIDRLNAETKEYEIDDIIEFEQSETTPGIEMFDSLYEAIINKETLKIKYCAYGKEIKEHVVSPYLIKEYRNRFYLVARKHDHLNDEELIYCYGMDRIKRIRKSDELYKRTKEFNAKNYFKHSFGITRKLDEEPIDLVLKFNAINMPYVLSKPLHSSQKIINQTNNSLTISIKVYESHELNMAILGYGAGVQVIAPKSYISYIKGVANGIIKLYNKK